MNNGYGDPNQSGATTIYCAQCGKAMLVAPEHVQIPVACPHCQHTIEPWRMTPTMVRGASPPPPPYGAGTPGQPGYSRRNRWVAGALGVLLGPWGVHRFYLGFVGIGITQIVVTIVTFGIGGVWGFIEGILCFCGAMRDVDGLPLRN